MAAGAARRSCFDIRLLGSVGWRSCGPEPKAIAVNRSVYRTVLTIHLEVCDSSRLGRTDQRAELNLESNIAFGQAAIAHGNLGFHFNSGAIDFGRGVD
jgi:hypothetical protein